jgi:hexosaminidase
MRKRILVLIGVMTLGFASGCLRVQTVPTPGPAPETSIIPRPLKIERLAGRFVLSPGTRIFIPTGERDIRQVAEYLARRLGASLNCGFEITEMTMAEAAKAPASPSNAFIFNKLKADDLGQEGYRLTAGPDRIILESAGPQGFFYGVQTIFQLLPPEIYSGENIPGIRWTIPAVEITDVPRYPWRGMLLDVSRHFFPKEFIIKFIDFLALHKMNTFHWHLTDDQGWRIEIKKYPKLTEVGAWRADREDKPWDGREPQREGERAAYGGYYTQDDIREIVAYAKSRFVTIVPEIEMPGHCMSALAAYPQLSCTGGPFTVPPGGVWPIVHVYCPGNDETFAFLEDVLTEVIDLFPGDTIHIGGDEVDKANWKVCPKCQARMKAEGLKTEEELQSWFIRRIEKFLNSKGKKLMGWDEILEGGLAPNAAVMSWRGTEGGIAAAREGHDVVMTPTSYCYFDYYQGRPDAEPPAIGGYLPLSKVYSFEPTPGELGPEEARHILGAQANLWTEYIATPEHAEYMIFPRIAAIAEAGWSAKDARNWDDFAARMNAQYERYRLAGVHYAKSAFNVRPAPEFDAATKGISIRLETETFRPDIRYTLDGSDPRASSTPYSRPLRSERSLTLKAGTFRNGELQGKITEMKFQVHKALGKAPKLTFPYKEKYRAGGDIALTDGLRGSKSHDDGHWQGFEGDDLIAEIDLGKAQKISRVSAGFLQNAHSWIFLPESVEFAVSNDGRDYRVVATIESGVSLQIGEPLLKDFTAEAGGANVRFIRVRAKNIGVCPPGHPGAGDKAWIFADEIIVE